MVRETRFQFDDPRSIYIPGMKDPFGDENDSVLEEYHPGELNPSKKKEHPKKTNPECETHKQKSQKNSPAEQVNSNPDASEPDGVTPRKAA